MADPKLEQATLANIGGGLLEQRFQEALCRAESIVADIDNYVLSRGKARAQLNLVLDFFVAADGALTVELGAKFKSPKLKGAEERIYLRDGEKLTWADPPEQLPLPSPDNVKQFPGREAARKE